MGHIRVLHCPTTVGGNPGGLAAAEREVGLDSHAVAFAASPFCYPVDEILWRDTDLQPMRELKRWTLLRRALRQYDIVHFNFGRPLMPQRIPVRSPAMREYSVLARWCYGLFGWVFELRDLPQLKRAGIGIAVTYQGDDARQGGYLRDHFAISPVDETEPGYYCDVSDRQKRRRIAIFERYADRIYALNPDLMHVLPERTRFVPYASVDPRRWIPSGAAPGTSPRLVIVHAPSHRGVKGTKHIVAAVDRLKRQDKVDCEFIIVENRPNEEARKLYERADLLVDQLLSGWYGALAVEVMALGKPVVAYIRESDLKFIPAGMRAELPIISATPQTIYDVMKQWLTEKREGLADLGRRGHTYVENWHDPLRIAASLKQDYESIVGSKAA